MSKCFKSIRPPYEKTKKLPFLNAYDPIVVAVRMLTMMMMMMVMVMMVMG